MMDESELRAYDEMRRSLDQANKNFDELEKLYERLKQENKTLWELVNIMKQCSD